MNIGERSLAETLRHEIVERVERDVSSLIKRPSKRLAGRVQALQEVLSLIDGEITTLNNPSPPANQET